MTIVEPEEKAENGVGNLAAQRLLKVYLVAIDHLAGIFCSPWQYDESQMILHHWDHRMRNVLLFLSQSSIDVLLEFLWQFFNYCRRVSNLLTVELNERQLPFFRVELELVVDILKLIRLKFLVLYQAKKLWKIKNIFQDSLNWIIVACVSFAENAFNVWVGRGCI